VSVELACHLCGSPELEIANDFAALKRVTSDCKPWPAGGMLALCRKCGLAQAPATGHWREEAAQIYREYTIYHQSGGAEQSVFNKPTIRGSPRSDAILAAMAARMSLPATGHLLDVGCGNGAFLRACSVALPGWRLCGTEVSDKYRSAVEAIAGVEQMFAGDFSAVEGVFDVVSLVHVLEHIPAPQGVLRAAMVKLKPGGTLLIEVPDCVQNPFMLLVADHCSHFSIDGLSELVASTGYEVLHATNEWVSREISLVGRAPAGGRAFRPARLPADQGSAILAGCHWIHKALQQAEETARAGDPFGIFGTSIAGTWLQGQMDGAASFFVDEDQNRVGRSHMGRPILSPAQLKHGSSVFVALPQPDAGRVAERLRHPGVLVRSPA